VPVGLINQPSGGENLDKCIDIAGGPLMRNLVRLYEGVDQFIASSLVNEATQQQRTASVRTEICRRSEVEDDSLAVDLAPGQPLGP